MATGIAIDALGNAYVTGITNAVNFPTEGPIQVKSGGGPFDAFVTKINPEGSAFVYSTYLGGKGDESYGNVFEHGPDIAVDGPGNALLTGSTSSTDFPTVSPLQPNLIDDGNLDLRSGVGDLFVVKIDNSPPSNPVPSVASISPSSTIAGGQGVIPLTVGGSNFVSRSVVRWNGTARATTFLGENSLRTFIPASDLSTVGTADVTVFTPGPGGGASNALTFAINPNPVPVLTTLAPSGVNAGGPPFILTILGSGFGPNSVIRWNGSDRSTSFPGQFGFSSLSANILASDRATAGDAQVTVFNPAPGGGVSNALTFTIACSYLPSASGQVFPAAGGTGAVTIYTSPSCPWTVANSLPWVTISGTGSGTGPGTLNFQVAADPGGRSGTFTVAGLPFRIEQQAASIPGLSFIGSMPHIAAQDVWSTMFTFVNKATSSATLRLNLFGDTSGPLTLPLNFPQVFPASLPLFGVFIRPDAGREWITDRQYCWSTDASSTSGFSATGGYGCGGWFRDFPAGYDHAGSGGAAGNAQRELLPFIL
jgi:hypothetical protein